MIKISYLREFVLLAETLNFSKTAEKSYITQPALSRHLALLEDEMGANAYGTDDEKGFSDTGWKDGI